MVTEVSTTFPEGSVLWKAKRLQCLNEDYKSLANIDDRRSQFVD